MTTKGWVASPRRSPLPVDEITLPSRLGDSILTRNPMVCFTSSRQPESRSGATCLATAYGYDDTWNGGPGGNLEGDDCLATYDYDPLGKPLHDKGDPVDINPFRPSTKYNHAYSGLNYYGFRLLIGKRLI